MIYGCVCMICRYGIYLDRDDDEDGVGAGVVIRGYLALVGYSVI